MKKAVCLQHVSFEGPGCFEKLLNDAGYALHWSMVPQEGIPSDPGEFLLIMGGPMSVNDREPWIAVEIEFIRNAIAKSIPCLGICLGSQLMAKAVGGHVYQGAEMEIGMTPVHLTTAGRKDPVLGRLPSKFEAFEWHSEGIALPDNAVVLAASKLFPVQAFRWGASAYGLLFHVEIEAPGVDALCAQCEMDLVRARLTSEGVQQQVEPHLPRLHEFAASIINAMTNLTPGSGGRHGS
jgi:GMP synthase-like glutamine amidotransferase